MIQFRPSGGVLRDHCVARKALKRALGSPHISPAFNCGQRCTAPSGVFSHRGARRTASTRSAPCEARRGSPVLSVACAMGPDSRRRDDGDVLHRRGAATTKAGPCRQQPGDGRERWPLPADAGLRPLASRAGSQAAERRRNPSGRWGSWPISALLVVDDARASTSFSRLDLGARAPSADGTGDPGRTSRSKTPLGTAPRRPRDETR
jgi:hypothetical protein